VLPRAAAAVLAVLLLSGSLGAPYLRDVLPFDKVEREDFTAIAVARQPGGDPNAPLDLHLHLEGDGADANLSAPFAWLRQHARIVVVPDARGAPLYLTRLDLSGPSGRATLGATVDRGMSAEVFDPSVDDCVVAHEILHFVGLGHVADPSNIMYPQCSRGHLERATLDAGQLAQIDALGAIYATTPSGVQLWATRGA
jgi:hypothetical protein